MGITPAGPFDVPFELALQWLDSPNPSGKPNSDVVRPYFNGNDLTKRAREAWTVDFGVDIPLEIAAAYEGPFRYLQNEVKPIRVGNRREAYASNPLSDSPAVLLRLHQDQWALSPAHWPGADSAQGAKPDEPTSLHYKGVTITPGGFMAAETVWRQKALSSHINSNLNANPFNGSSAAHVSEFNASGRQSRFSLLTEGKLDNVKIGG